MLEKLSGKVQETLCRVKAWKAGMYYPDSILALELTDFCNCNCIMCSQSVSNIIHGKKKGFMAMETFRGILSSISSTGIRLGKCLPFGLGESLLHPAFPELLSELLDFNRNRAWFDSIDLHTNAILLNEKIVDILLMQGSTIDTISFSLDAATTDTYMKIRRNRQLETAVSNIKRFLERRAASGVKKPKTHIQFIVMEENRHEASEFFKLWSSIFKDLKIPFQVNYDWHPPMKLDTIFFKRLNPFKSYDLSKAEQLHREVALELGLVNEDKSSERIIESDEHVQEFHKARRPCSGPFKYQSVSWDGTVTVCCIDTARELALGNVNETPLMELWEGELNRNYRLWHIKGLFEKMPKCQNCHNLDSPTMSDDEIASYLSGTGNKELLGDYMKRMHK